MKCSLLLVTVPFLDRPRAPTRTRLSCVLVFASEDSALAAPSACGSGTEKCHPEKSRGSLPGHTRQPRASNGMYCC